MKIKDRVVVFPDIHFPNQDEKAFSCALKIIKAVNPTAFLLLGDVIDGNPLVTGNGKKRGDHLSNINYLLSKKKSSKEIEDSIGLTKLLKKLERRKKSFRRATMNYGSTTSSKKTHTSNNTDQEKHSSSMSEVTSGIPTVKYFPCLKVSSTLTTGDIIWESAMPEHTLSTWVATSSMGIPTIARRQSSHTLTEPIWHIHLDV